MSVLDLFDSRQGHDNRGHPPASARGLPGLRSKPETKWRRRTRHLVPEKLADEIGTSGGKGRARLLIIEPAPAGDQRMLDQG